jgi:hypothetical protein
MGDPIVTETEHEITVETRTWEGEVSPEMRSGVRTEVETARVSFPEAADRDPYNEGVREVGRIIGGVFRWFAYILLLVWTACAPESLAPYIFQGFLIGDFGTWGTERFLQRFVWRTHRFSLGQIGGDLLAFGILFAIFKATDGSAMAGHPVGYGATETGIAIFFTCCARTVSIGVRRMHDITLGTGR